MNILIKKLCQALARNRLAGREFSIISNNCWGAHAYQNAGLRYATPFVGLFIPPKEYLRLLADFERLMAQPLTFKNRACEDWVNRVRDAGKNPWPIGVLGDRVEIHFMHYQTEAEAEEAWERRTARLLALSPGRLFFKFDDRDGCTPEQAADFARLPFGNKVFFTTQTNIVGDCVVRIPADQSTVPDGLELSKISPRYFDAAGWILGHGGKPIRWLRWLNCI